MRSVNKHDIIIRDFYHNGKKLAKTDAYLLQMNEYCRNIELLLADQENSNGE